MRRYSFIAKSRCLLAIACALTVAASSASAAVTYDYSAGAGTVHFAYKDRVNEIPIPPASRLVPATPFSTTNYDRLVASDNLRYATGNIGDDDDDDDDDVRAATRFVFTIAQSPPSLSELTIHWEGRAQNGGTVRLYVWNANTSSYSLIASTTSTTDTVLSRTYTTDASAYVDADNKVTVLAINTSEMRGVTTDYIKITVSQCLTHADCDDGNDCTTDQCHLGLCRHENNTSPCSDDNPCTMGDACSNGVCLGGPPPNCEEACDQCNTASCDPQGAPGNCDRHTPRPNGIPCDDDFFCTVQDACQSGVCRGSPRDCGSHSDPCHVGVCDETANSCAAAPVINGTSCDDGQFCTVDDACVEGACGGRPRDCSGAGDQCNAGQCNEDTNECEPRPLADGLGCDDQLYCTVEDACVAGRCQGHARDCGELADQCNRGACNEDFDKCQAEPLEDGLLCNDDLYCTVDDHCIAGACRGGQRDCSSTGDQCNTGICDEEENSCARRPVEDGFGCDDELFCTVKDSCAAGSCHGQPRDCTEAGDQCNHGVCNEQENACAREPRENGISCTDGLFCTVEDTCRDGVCSGPGRSCEDHSDQCNMGFCLEQSGECVSIPLPDGTGCDDGLYCTVKDMCSGGTCGGLPRSCDYLSDQCNVGVCNESSAECSIRPLADGTECDDSLYCTVEDVCTEGLCAGVPRDCSSLSDQCNTGICNEKLDECIAQHHADGTECNDHDVCNVGEVCTQGHCLGGQAPQCPGIQSCLMIACDTKGSEGNCDLVTPVPDGSPCDDGAFCTGADACAGGECRGGSEPCDHELLCNEDEDSCVECLAAGDCDDEVECTRDACEEGTCVHTPTNDLCPDNELHCDGREFCDAILGCSSTGDPCPQDQMCDESRDACGECLTDADCNDAVDCTINRCVKGGCVYTASDDLCENDGQFCSGIEICDAAAGCISTGDPCTIELYCNEKTDACDQCTEDGDCDDGDPCTIGHACVAGQCRSAEPVDCSGAGDQCNAAACDRQGEPGNCELLIPREDGTECDDGAYCSVSDVCHQGVCTGQARDCGDLADQCNSASCNEETDACERKAVEDGIACDDDLFCTVEDSCTAGVCKGSTRNCSAFADQCNLASCNEEENKCQNAPVADGTSCDDELYCTVEDVCHEGSCRGASRDCGEHSDQCNAGVCNEKEQSCTKLPVADGVSCNDNNACNVGESCLAGQCQGGAAQECAGLGDPCNTVACDPEGSEGNCDLRKQVENGTTCDDGLLCTIEDACKEGVCAGGPKDCGGLDDTCNTGFCNESSGACERRPVDDGTLCDDHVHCTVNDVCVLGVCGGNARDCSYLSDACNVGVCNEESDSCEARPVVDGTTCDDALYCTVEDACTNGVCGGKARVCDDLTDQCNAGVCDEESNECVARPVEDGAACDDELFCTVKDACKSGECMGVERRDCGEHSNQCNVGSCNEESDACEAMPAHEGEGCDDELYCTVDDACRQGVCTGMPRACGSSEDQCKKQVCDEETDTCELKPQENGSRCDDAYECTTNDSCENGACVSSRTFKLEHWTQLSGCLVGIDERVAPECECVDLDGDGRVDLIDVSELMRLFEGQ